MSLYADPEQDETPEEQLNLRLRHPDFQDFLDINERKSAETRRLFDCRLNEPYGPEALQAMDVFPASEPDAPIFVFIHGGYWRGLDKSSYTFTAGTFLRHGFAACVVNYRLLPAIDLELVVTDVRDGLRHIREAATRSNGRPDALVIAGHSAGAHLALMVCLLDEDIRTATRAVCAMSGLYDLDPIRKSYLNKTLRFTPEIVRKYSPLHLDLSILPFPLLLTVGAGETDLFRSQTRDLHERNEGRTEYFEHPGLNHYQIVHKLLEEKDPLSRFILKHGRGAE